MTSFTQELGIIVNQPFFIRIVAIAVKFQDSHLANSNLFFEALCSRLTGIDRCRISLEGTVNAVGNLFWETIIGECDGDHIERRD